MPRPQTGYLYQRGAVWWVQFQYPRDTGRKAVQRSLKTKDRREAELLALPLIEQHKRELWVASNRRNGHYLLSRTDDYAYPLGKTVRPDGSTVWGSSESALIIHVDGRTEEVANGPRVRVTQDFDPDQGGFKVWVKTPGQPSTRPKTESPSEPELKAKRPAPGTDPDLQLLETYLDLQPRSEHFLNDARRSWTRFKEFVDHRPLSKCTRADGHAFVKHLRAMDPAPAPVTIRKWISHLKAPIAHGLPKHDPAQDIFYKLQGKVEVQTKRLPLFEDDMALFRERAFPSLGPEERLLWTMMASTGMRTSECADITEEFEEKGIRYWIVGRKSATSVRRVPIPDAVLPLIPEKITGPLFTKNHVIVGKNLLRAMRRIGITDERKVVYSLRHRAHDRLRDAQCPPDIMRELVGHDEATVHDSYGKGYPVRILKDWVEKIGV